MLQETLKGLGQTFVEILSDRMETLSLDIKEARIHLVSIMILGALIYFLISLGVILGVLLLVFAFWESHRLLVLGILTAAFLGFGSIMSFLLARWLRKGPKLFEGTISELNKDREALGFSGKGMIDGPTIT